MATTSGQSSSSGTMTTVVRQSGRGILTNGCDKLTIEATIEFFYPPMAYPDGDPIVVEYEDAMDAYRLEVSEPVPVPAD